MGLLDLPAPLLTAFDAALGLLPPLARLLLWAAITGAVSMLCYRACSAQEKIAAAKREALTARRALNAYAGHEFAEMWQLVGASLRASGRHVGAVFGPALLGSLPALLIIVWVSNQFGYRLPPAEANLAITASPDPGLQLPRDGDHYVARYPVADTTLAIVTTDEFTLTTLPLAGAVPVIHKKQWWNTLIGNRAGYLEPAAPVDELRMGLEAQRFHSLGPAWAQSWEAPYFLALIITSLGIKFIFRIE